MDQAFLKLLSDFNVEANQQTLSAFENYYNYLKEENSKLNLVSQAGKEEIYLSHIADSVSFNLVKPIIPNNINGISTLDIGSGGGFPAVPIAIISPELNIVMVESVGKKAAFLERVCRDVLNLTNTRVVTGRVEELGQNSEYRESIDVVTSRAVAGLNVLLEYALPLLKEGGIFVAYKTEKEYQDTGELKNVLETLGGRLEQVINYQLPGKSLKRLLLVYKKIAKTPDRYPRKPGIPAKRPLK